MKKVCRAIGVFALTAVMAGCRCSGDAPLLTTLLPNGYSMDSNGGSYGVIYGPSGALTELKAQLDDTERWCNAFGWEGAVVVCQTEHGPFGQSPDSLGYLIVNTETAETWLVANEKDALKRLQSLSIASLPRLSTRYFFYTRER